MNYGLHVELLAHVDGPDPSELDAALEQLMDELHGMEGSSHHLDCSVGISTADDGLRAHVEVDLTVSATSLEAGFAVGMTWLRTAAHATGARTPGWENARPGVGIVVFDVPEVTLSQLHELADV